MFATFRKPSRSDWVLIGIFWTAALPFVFSGYDEIAGQIG